MAELEEQATEMLCADHRRMVMIEACFGLDGSAETFSAHATRSVLLAEDVFQAKEPLARAQSLFHTQLATVQLVREHLRCQAERLTEMQPEIVGNIRVRTELEGMAQAAIRDQILGNIEEQAERRRDTYLAQDKMTENHTISEMRKKIFLNDADFGVNEMRKMSRIRTGKLRQYHTFLECWDKAVDSSTLEPMKGAQHTRRAQNSCITYDWEPTTTQAYQDAWAKAVEKAAPLVARPDRFVSIANGLKTRDFQHT